jgi:hypothetical protein
MRDLKILSYLMGVFTVGVVVSFVMALKTSHDHQKQLEALTKPASELALPQTAQ